MTNHIKIILSAAICQILALGACAEKESKPDVPALANTAKSEALEQKAVSVEKQPDTPPCRALESLTDEQRSNIPKDVILRHVTDGSGSLALPMPGATSNTETHTRHPWKMPQGAANAVAVIRWEDTTWGEVEFALGTGICPHRGRKLAGSVSSAGLAVVHYVRPSDGISMETDWFLHVNADKALETKAGEEFKYRYEICAY